MKTPKHLPNLHKFFRSFCSSKYLATSLRTWVLAGVVGPALWSCGSIKDKTDQILGLKNDKDSRNDHPRDHSSDPGSNLGGTLELSKAIVTFKDCGETEKWIEDRMIQKLEKALKQQLERLSCSEPWDPRNPKPTRWQSCQPIPDQPILSPAHIEKIENRPIPSSSPNSPVATADSAKSSVPQSSSTSSSAPSSAPTSEPGSTTGTNNQVAGVEEADLVKAQGDRIYQLARGQLNIMLGWPANQAKLLGSLKIEGSPLEMYVSDAGKVIVISSFEKVVTDSMLIPLSQVTTGRALGSGIQSTLPRSEPSFPRTPSTSLPTQEPTVIVTTVDTTDPQNASIQSKRLFRGNYLSSRKIGDDLRLVVTEPFGVMNTLIEQIAYAGGSSTDPAELEQRLRDLVDLYTKRIQAKTIQDWLLTNNTNGTGPQIGLCERVYGPNYETDLGVTRIITLKKGAELPVESVLLSTVNGLYASQESLYLSTLHNREPENQQGTVLHKFAWESSGNSIYRGSGQVDGVLINQFAMDEYQGYLRVAATAQDPKTFQSVNKISVLSEGEGILQTRGATPNLANGERIYSVRFAGPRGFLVTFRRVDPLFTLDLKDPAQPTVVGELKVPGFSSYIHMMDNNTLLTIGRGGPGQSVSNTKLSVFDVSNLAQPKEIKTFIIDNGVWQNSEAETNHKAITYYDQKGILAIPMNGFLYSRSPRTTSAAKYDSSILVFDVKNEPVIKALGSIDIGNFNPSLESHTNAAAQRSLFMDDYIYGFSNIGMKVRKLGQLDQDVAVVTYP